MDLSTINSSCLYSGDLAIEDVTTHPDFRYLCELIREIKGSRTDRDQLNSCIQSIKKILKRMFGVDFEMTIVDNDLSSELFVCNVFPPYSHCKEIADLIIEENVNEIAKIREIWECIPVWHVDLDSRLFFDTSAMFNDAEVAALIIYNIERIAFSYHAVTRANYIVNKNFAERSYTMNKLARSHVCRNLFVLPFFTACMFKSYSYTELPFVAGSCFETHVYLKEAYLGAVRKILATAGNGDIDKCPHTIDLDIQGVCDWIFAAIQDLKYSTHNLKDTLKKVVLSMKSYYVKNIIVDILTTFGSYSKDDVLSLESLDPISRRKLKLNPVALENRSQLMETHKERKILAELNVVRESFLDLLDSIGNMKKVTQRDIDMLKVEAQKIVNTDDKLYVLDSVHGKLDIIETSLALLESGDQLKIKKVKATKSALLEMKKELDTIRDSVIKHEVKSDTYGLFIKYPQGYEG